MVQEVCLSAVLELQLGDSLVEGFYFLIEVHHFRLARCQVGFELRNLLKTFTYFRLKILRVLRELFESGIETNIDLTEIGKQLRTKRL